MALELPVGRLGAPSVTLFSRALVAFGAVLALVVPVLAAPTLTPPAQAVEPDEVELQFPLWGTHIAGVVAAQPLTMGGIELELAVLGPGPTWTPVGENWSTCVSDTAGFCSFFVPASYHQNHSGETWRVQTPAGSEWWVFVHNTANPASQFQTSIMNNRFGRTLQQPALHLVAPNPPLPAGCSLNVALVMDYSGSMAGYERDMTNAADVFVDALTGTDTTFTVYSFSNVSPIPGMTNRTTPISIRTQAGADQVKATYSGWRATGGTNYGPPLRNVINAGNPTDVVIFMTDGAPSDDPAGAQAANALKLAGTRVIGFGVGQVSVSPTSLQSISGRTLDSDYYLAANFAQVSTYLEEIAAGRCTAALEIEAREAPVNQNKAYVNRLTGAAASDWHYTAQVVSSGEQVDGTTDDTGLVSLPVPITPNTTTRVLVTQTTKIGWELLQQSGVNATCFLKSDQNTILSTTPGPGDSFFLDLPAGEIATCVFVNGQYFTAPLQVLSREASPNQDKSSVNATTGSPASGWHYMAAIGTTAQAQDTTNASGLAALPLPVNSATGTTTVLVTQTNKTDWELLEQSGLVATCYLTNSPSQSVTTTNAAGVPGGFYVDLPGDQAVTCVVVNGQYFTAPLQVLSREASPNQDKASVNATTGSPAQGWHYTAAIGTTAQVQDTTNASGLAALPLPVTSATGTTTVLVTQSNKTDWELLQQSGLVATCHLTNNPSQSVATTNAAGVSGGFYVDLPGDQAVTCVFVNGQYFTAPLQVLSREASPNQVKSMVNSFTGAPAQGWQYTAVIDGTSTQAQDTTSASGLAALPLPVDSATGTTKVLVTQTNKTAWELLQQSGLVATCHLTNDPSQSVATTNAAGVAGGFYVDLPGDQAVTCVFVNGQYFTSPLQVLSREAPPNQDKASVNATTGAPAQGWHYTARIVGTSDQVSNTTNVSGLANLPIPVESQAASTLVQITQTVEIGWELLPQSGLVATCHLTQYPDVSVTTVNVPGTPGAFIVDLPGDQAVTCVFVNGQYFTAPLQVLSREASPNQDKSAVTATTGSPASGWHYTAAIGTTAQVQDTTNASGLAALPLPVNSATGTTTVLVTQTNKTDWELLQQSGQVATCYLTNSPSQSVTTTNAAGVPGGFYVDLPGDQAVTCVVVNGQYFTAPLQVLSREASPNQDKSSVNATTGSPAQGWHYTAAIGTTAQAQDTTNASGLAALPLPVDSATGTTTVLVTQSNKTDWELLQQSGLVATCHLTNNPSQSVATTNAAGVSGGFYVDLPGDQAVTCVVVNGQYFTAPLQVLSREASPNQVKSMVNSFTGAPAQGWQYTAVIDGTSTQAQDTTSASGLAALPLPVDSATGTTKVLVTQTNKPAWELLQQSGLVATCHLTNDPSQSVATTNAAGVAGGFYVDLPGDQAVTCVFVNGQYFTSPLQVLSREAPPNQDKASVNATTGAPAQGWHYTAAIGTTAQAQDTTNASGLAALPLPVTSATGTTTVLVTQTNKTDWELLEQSGLVATCHLTNNPSQSVPASNAASVSGGFYVDLPGDQAVTCVVVNGQYFTAPLQVVAREAPPNQDKASVDATTGSPASGWQYTAVIDGTSIQAQDTTSLLGPAALPLPVESATGTTTVLVTQTNKPEWELLQQSGLVATCFLTFDATQSVATRNVPGTPGAFYVDLPGDQAVTCVVVNGQYFTAPLQVLSRQAPPNQDKASVNATTGSPAQGWHYTAVIDTTTQAQDTTNASGLAALPLPVNSATGTTKVLVTQTNKTAWELLEQSGLVATCHLTLYPDVDVTTTNVSGTPGAFYVDLPGDQAVTCVVVNGQYFTAPLQVQSRQAPPNQDKSSVDATTGSPAQGWHYTAVIDTTTQAQDTTSASGLAALPLPVNSATVTTTVLVTQTNKTDWELLEQSGLVATCYLTNSPNQSVPASDATGVPGGFYVELPGDAAVTCVVVNGQYFTAPLQVQSRQAPPNQNKALVGATTGAPAQGWQYTAVIDGTSTQAQDTTNASGLAALPLPVNSATVTTTVLVTQSNKTDWELLQQSGLVATCHLTNDPSQSVPASNATGVPGGFYVELPGDAAVTCVVVNGQYFTAPLQVQSRQAPVNQLRSGVTAATGSPASGWQYTAVIGGTATQAQDTTNDSGLAALPLPVNSATGTTTVLVTQSNKPDWDLLPQSGLVATCHLTANPSQGVTTTNATGVPGGFYVVLPGDAAVTCVVVNGQYFTSPLQVVAREAPVNQERSAVTAATGSPASGWQYTAVIDGTTTGAQDTTSTLGPAALPLPVSSASGTTTVLVTQTDKSDWELLEQSGLVATCFLTNTPTQGVDTWNATGTAGGFYVDLPGDQAVTCVVVNGQYFTSSLQVESRHAPVNQDKSAVDAATGTPAPGWHHTAAIDGTGTQVEDVTGGLGRADLSLPVTSPTGTTRVLVTRTAQDGWELLEQSGLVATCYLTNDPTQQVPTTNAPGIPGAFYVDLPGNEAVTCVMVHGQYFSAALQVEAREAPLNQDKSTVDATTGTPAEGWEYTALVEGTTTQAQDTTGATGLAALPLPVASATGTTTVLVTQGDKSDWELLEQSGLVATCYLTNDPTQALTTRNASGTGDAFYVDLPGDEAVTCVLVNGQYAAPPPVPSPPPMAVLSFTGADLTFQVVFGIGALTIGFWLVAVARRRRREET